ncbi:MAG TPA: 2-oxoglutarate dehydrogenase E1 component [Gammaproteobacteria bacterium]|jgi:2-oxoglutarate dehydrogenase E1 component|nr:2-oxoglutarate dehydrogenase E1 component [Gammaproteobacteria bacterium]
MQQKNKAQEKSFAALRQDSYLGENEAYLEGLYEDYLVDPESVSAEWRAFFDGMRRGAADVPHADIQAAFLALARHNAAAVVPGSMSSHQDQQQEKVAELISAYRRLGHLRAHIDPLDLYQGTENQALDLNYYGLNGNALAQTFHVGSFLGLGKSTGTLSEIQQALARVYCGSIGFEYMHINRAEEVEWIRDRIEKNWANFKPTVEEKKRILQQLVGADGVEKYLGFKYVGQKRFSLEGGDGLIPMLETIIQQSAKQGVKEATIGMAHRGRLNVLMNVVGKEPKAIFAAFEGTHVSSTHSGDVKYHLGFSSDRETPYGPVHIALAFNPSHLEIVAPVAQGSVRARQRRRRDTNKVQVLPIQIHGDAAFAGQGVVMETFTMSQARWFTVGGSIHIVINNQVGFTTSNPQDARSTIYCTDVAKMVEAPILHVNGNDAEAVYFAALFAADYRQVFKRDVVIDLFCYRRHGHNEADEPSATQPLMYKVIKAMPAPYVIYAKQLAEEGVIEVGTEKALAEAYRDALDADKTLVPLSVDKSANAYAVNWEPFISKLWTDKADTSVPIKEIKALGKKLEVLPEGFVVQPQVKKTLEARQKMTAGEVPVNWGYAETLAYATLLNQKYPIRLCGQDAGRGTFAHRHAVLHDQNTDEVYIPLSHIADDQAQINIVDSLLSEEGVLAFEYGYATAEPNFLVIWEAQFGDFANGAQVVIDQFISSGEQKWGRLCGLVMLLPHGYEGQGPEHSSARLERYLQLCAQDNMQVCMPSTPAQIFHLLRRQMVRAYRKPLIVMTPKSLLRHPLAVSPLEDLTKGGYQLVVGEVDTIAAQAVERVIFCAGKVYYELLEARREMKMDKVAILRLEQFYPFPEVAMRQALAGYKGAKEVVWCQEEPRNQGAWTYLEPYLTGLLSKTQTLHFAGRAASASPAVGYHAVHEKEQKELIIQALTK